MSPVLICAAVSNLLSEHKEALKQKAQGSGLMGLSGEPSRVPGNQKPQLWPQPGFVVMLWHWKITLNVALMGFQCVCWGGCNAWGVFLSTSLGLDAAG